MTLKRPYLKVPHQGGRNEPAAERQDDPMLPRICRLHRRLDPMPRESSGNSDLLQLDIQDKKGKCSTLI